MPGACAVPAAPAAHPLPAAGAPPQRSRWAPLQHLHPAAFGAVMGGCGLALAWQRASALMGDLAGAVAWVLGGLSALLFGLLVLASLQRARHFAAAWAGDLKHPVRHQTVAAISAAALLLATVAAQLLGPSAPVLWLWRVSALAHGAITLWVLGRWWTLRAPGQPDAAAWAGVTPVLFIPVVGNVLAPLAGVGLGQAEWAAAQFAVGALFWPLVLLLLMLRLLLQGPLPERVLPARLIVVAPPAVIGLGLLALGAPRLVAWGLWGVAVFSLLWAAQGLRRLADQPIGLGHWGLSFPLAALASLTLALATPGAGWMGLLAPLALALATLVVLGLSLATVRGLRAGTLLVPEPVAMISAGSAPASPAAGR